MKGFGLILIVGIYVLIALLAFNIYIGYYKNPRIVVVPVLTSSSALNIPVVPDDEIQVLPPGYSA